VVLVPPTRERDSFSRRIHEINFAKYVNGSVLQSRNLDVTNQGRIVEMIMAAPLWPSLV